MSTVPVHAERRGGERRKLPNAAAHLARVIAEDAPLVPRGEDRRVLSRQQWNDPGRRAGTDRRRPMCSAPATSREQQNEPTEAGK